jgi:hypothetical protein
LLGQRHSLARTHYAHLLAFFIDQQNLAGIYPFVNSRPAVARPLVFDERFAVYVLFSSCFGRPLNLLQHFPAKWNRPLVRVLTTGSLARRRAPPHMLKSKLLNVAREVKHAGTGKNANDD